MYVVYYYGNYDDFNLVSIFSTEEKAKDFLELCKKPFYKGIVLYDYRGYRLEYEKYEVDEFENVVPK